ncbi:MAG: hypothetical protein HXY34_06825 [Candidatus Thorarchaeota archaeon]|nr:hypothetical protein [Candidatus Thorarchaeota archaeon]
MLLLVQCAADASQLGGTNKTMVPTGMVAMSAPLTCHEGPTLCTDGPIPPESEVTMAASTIRRHISTQVILDGEMIQ